MTLRELLNQIENVREIAQVSPENMDVLIEDLPGEQYVIGEIYFSSPSTIAFDIHKVAA